MIILAAPSAMDRAVFCQIIRVELCMFKEVKDENKSRFYFFCLKNMPTFVGERNAFLIEIESFGQHIRFHF